MFGQVLLILGSKAVFSVTRAENALANGWMSRVRGRHTAEVLSQPCLLTWYILLCISSLFSDIYQRSLLLHVKSSRITFDLKEWYSVRLGKKAQGAHALHVYVKGKTRSKSIVQRALYLFCSSMLVYLIFRASNSFKHPF